MRAKRIFWVGAVSLLGTSVALAEIDPKCEGLPKPGDYDEQVQQDFQANYYALAASFSPMHSAIPHEGGHGSLGVDLSVMPPLSCEQRYVLDWTKTEDTNKTPILPRITASYAFPELWDRVVFYGAFGFLPPIPFAGTRNLIVSGELGVGVSVVEHFDVGVRYHVTSQRTFGDIATAFDPETEPSVEDAYISSTWGIDAMLGFPIAVKEQVLSPYVAVGFLDASTMFYIGDGTGSMIDNLHPYNGVAFSVGLDTLLFKHLRLSGEFYGAPGGYSLPNPDVVSVTPASRYGQLYTARFRIGWEF